MSELSIGWSQTSPTGIELAQKAFNTELPVFGKGVKLKDLINVILAEFIGSGLLMVIGCPGYAHDDRIPRTSIHRPVYFMYSAFIFGFIYMAATKLFGHLSQAHFNPSVTLASLIVGRLTLLMGVIYFFAQILGVLTGYGLYWVYRKHIPEGRNCCTIPHGRVSLVQAFFHEFLATVILLLMICAIWDRRNWARADSTPLKIGFCYFLLMLTVGRFSGASMNPARSFAPAVYEGCWREQWIYWFAPLLAALLVGVLHRFLLSAGAPQKESESVVVVVSYDCSSTPMMEGDGGCANAACPAARARRIHRATPSAQNVISEDDMVCTNEKCSMALARKPTRVYPKSRRIQLPEEENTSCANAACPAARARRQSVISEDDMASRICPGEDCTGFIRRPPGVYPSGEKVESSAYVVCPGPNCPGRRRDKAPEIKPVRRKSSVLKAGSNKTVCPGRDCSGYIETPERGVSPTSGRKRPVEVLKCPGLNCPGGKPKDVPDLQMRRISSVHVHSVPSSAVDNFIRQEAEKLSTLVANNKRSVPDPVPVTSPARQPGPPSPSRQPQQVRRRLVESDEDDDGERSVPDPVPLTSPARQPGPPSPSRQPQQVRRRLVESDEDDDGEQSQNVAVLDEEEPIIRECSPGSGACPMMKKRK